MSSVNVLLVDDHNIVRQGLKALLAAEQDITVLAEAQSGREAVNLAARLRPEVIVMDLAMPLLNGWEATRQILKAVPAARVVVLSTYFDDEHVQQAIAAGAAAYLIKQTAAVDLVKAIEKRKCIFQSVDCIAFARRNLPAARRTTRQTEGRVDGAGSRSSPTHCRGFRQQTNRGGVKSEC